jgi:hypothetical protein
MKSHLLTSIAAAAALLAVGLTDTARASEIGRAASLSSVTSPLTLDYNFSQGTRQNVWTSFVLTTVGDGGSELIMKEGDPNGAGGGWSTYPPRIHTSTSGMWGLGGYTYATPHGVQAIPSVVVPVAGDVVYLKVHLDVPWPAFYEKKTLSLWINPADTSSEAALGTPAVTFEHIPWVVGRQGYVNLSVAGGAVLSDVVVGGDLADVSSTPAALVADAGVDKSVFSSSPSVMIGGTPAASGGTPGTSPPYTYSWSPTEGLDDPTLANPIASPTSTTTYTLTVTDSASAQATDEVLVTYTVPPLVADAGVDKSVFSSSPSVMIGGTPAASGGSPGISPPYTYSWSPSEGLDDPTLANPTASPTSTTTYTLTVKDSLNVEASDSMTVTFILPPSNDNFADAITLPGNSGTQTGTNNMDATSQVDEPAFKAGYEAPNLQKTVWFKWTCAETGTFNLSTAGSTNTAGAAWDASVYIYDGDTLATLNQLAFSDNVSAETVALPVTAGTTYHIRLSWGGGPSGNAAAEMNATNLLLSWSLALPVANRPDVISIDVVSEGSTAVSGDVAGSPVTGQSGLWNRLVGNSMPVTLSELKNGAGDPVSNVGFTAAYTGGSFQQFQPNSDITGGPATGVVLAADSPERLDISGSTAALTFAFTNLLPGDTYALVIYNTGYSAGVLTINGGTPHTNVPTVLTTYEVADGDGKITGVATFNGATHSGYFALSGFQLYALGSVPSGYDSWAADHAGNQTPDLDYDHDGVPNGVEYFMGSPDGFTKNPGLLSGKVTWPHVNPVAAFAVQVSANLSDWSPADPLDIDTTTDPGLVSYTLPKGATKKFCRLVVTP